MGRYLVQWWNPDSRRWVNGKRFIFKCRAMKHMSKHATQLSSAKKWQLVDMRLSNKIITRILVTVERKD